MLTKLQENIMSQISEEEIKKIMISIFGNDCDISLLKNNKMAIKFIEYLQKNRKKA